MVKWKGKSLRTVFPRKSKFTQCETLPSFNKTIAFCNFIGSIVKCMGELEYTVSGLGRY